ncbi:MAG: precorrin-3B C(17)-methyltransferase [Deltaproteobacteria bacterium]|nr:precorrin-3B C(17)-methyltransferase [Deltaproteobacteria bacterium]
MRLQIVGLGPGRDEVLSFQARAALSQAEVIVGYKTYLDQVGFLLEGKRIVSSAMTQELDRAGTALDLALAGDRVVVISGGDPGIYAMAGVVFELARARAIPLGSGPEQLQIEVIPGVPALAAAAAILGAPLTHDFACISLSDRLTPWDVITKRLSLTAQADLVIVLYNPKSRGRHWQFGQACQIVAQTRPPDTPMGLVTNAMRDEGEKVVLTTLGQAASTDVDMHTIVIIGNSQTFVYGGRMVTPRGYVNKYGGK